MSKKTTAQIICPKCDNKFSFQLYRTIHGENPENRELVMLNQINVATCPSCGNSTKIPFALMYTNTDKQFAVWWEPEYDPQIDIDMKQHAEYANRLQAGFHLANAPRVKDWEKFKETIRQFERGEIRKLVNLQQNDNEIQNKKTSFKWFDTKKIVDRSSLTEDELKYIQGKSITFLGPFNVLVRRQWDLLLFLFVLPNIIGFGLEYFPVLIYLPMVWFLWFSVVHSRRLAWNRNEWKSFSDFKKSEKGWFPASVLVAVYGLFSLMITYSIFRETPITEKLMLVISASAILVLLTVLWGPIYFYLKQKNNKKEDIILNKKSKINTKHTKQFNIKQITIAGVVATVFIIGALSYNYLSASKETEFECQKLINYSSKSNIYYIEDNNIPARNVDGKKFKTRNEALNYCKSFIDEMASNINPVEQPVPSSTGSRLEFIKKYKQENR